MSPVRKIFPVAALALLLLGVLPAEARVNVVTLPGRDSVQLTIYNSIDLTMVKETRLLTFRKGLNKLEFSWANTLIDPTSVEFRALSHADAVEVLDASFPPRVSNTLEWRINSEFAGEVQVEIRYFTSGINWSADYLAEAGRTEKLMDLAGFVRVNNNSGEDYENAQIRLVVGTIRLVEEIKQLATNRGFDKLDSLVRLKALKDVSREDLGLNLATELYSFAAAGDRAAKKAEVVKEALSEYFLYTVEGRDTIPNGWSKRLPSFTATNVPVASFYKFEKEQWGDQAIRFYKFKNDQASHLGREPLPDGAVVAFRTLDDRDRLYSFVGRTAVKYIPVQEEVELSLGADVEVAVRPLLKNWEKSDIRFDNNGNITGWTVKETWEIELQNSREIDVTVDLRRTFPGDWEVGTKVSFEKLDAHKIKFLVPLKPREKTELTYELTTRFGTNATR